MSTESTTVMIDAHVHFYDCFDLNNVVGAAQKHFEYTLAKHVDAHHQTSKQKALCLLCVDLQDKELEEEIKRLRAVPGLHISERNTDEPSSRTVTNENTGFSMQIVWGHQIICAENIELLAFGLSEKIPNGTSLLDAISSTGKMGSFGILPWGFGKWTGERGQIVRHVLEGLTSEKSDLLVGDNGGRWSLSSKPALLQYAESRSIWNIPGSDPLPFPAQEAKLGSRGVILNGHYDTEKPLSSIARLINELEHPPVDYGTGESTLNFLMSQTKMQLRKHLKRSS